MASVSFKIRSSELATRPWSHRPPFRCPVSGVSQHVHAWTNASGSAEQVLLLSFGEGSPLAWAPKGRASQSSQGGADFAFAAFAFRSSLRCRGC